MISRNLLPGWLRKAIQVTNCVKSVGPIEWVVDVCVVVVFVFVLVLVAFEGPRDFMKFVTRMASKSHPGNKFHEIAWAYRVGC